MKNDKVVNKGFKLAVNKPILVVYLVFLYIRLYWGMQGRDTNLLWRYASRFYTDLGVVLSLFDLKNITCLLI